MLILELLLLILYGIGLFLYVFNSTIENKFGLVGAFLIVIYVVSQLLIRFI
jgi:hypothetical protein